MTALIYWNALILPILVACVVLVAGAFRRLFHHPLRRYPGPRFAGVTGYYRAYYDICKDGGMLENLEKLHERYGPVVRIAPDELHFSDPHAYNVIYAQGSKFMKHRELYDGWGMEQALFGALNAHDAKIRKDALAPLFSRRAILQLEHVIQEKAKHLISRLASFKGEPANLSGAFRSTSLDVISSYAFARSVDALDDPIFHHPLLTSIDSAFPLFWIFKHFPVIKSILLQLPTRLPIFAPQKGLMDVRAKLITQINTFFSDRGALAHAEHETIYHHLLTPKAEHQVPSPEALLQEAESVIMAGTDTVGNTCVVAAVYVLSDKAIRTKLVHELDEAWPDSEASIGYETLEKLPYLTAVIKESLRMSNGSVTPLARVVGPSDAEIVGNHVPAGSVVGIGTTFVHRNEAIFPEPLRFIPERWLQQNARELESYLVPFSKGPRSCIGINLAWCELYVILGNVFRKLDLELHDSSVDDLKFREYFNPWYRSKIHACVRLRTV